MSAASAVQPLYPTRSAAGAELGRQLYQRVTPPVLVLGVTPGGVEVAAHAARALACPFDVIVAAPIRVPEAGVVGAVAEDADAVMDPGFEPRFSMIEALEAAINSARQTVKTERLLFRGQRPLRSVEGVHVVVVEGFITDPWAALAAAEAVARLEPARVAIAAAAATAAVQDRMRARRHDVICPSIVAAGDGHPQPFGDALDPSAERLRSIVAARAAA